MGGVSAGGELKRNHVSSARGLKEATTLSSAGGLMRARCHLQGFVEGKMSSALGRMVPLQGCGRQAPQCQELAGDSSRTCCCPDGDHNKMSKSRGSLRSTK
jgi:hypothetical protein